MLLALAAVLPWWALIVPFALYAFLYDAWELVCIGVALDLFFGAPLPWLPVPLLYTAGTLALVVLCELVKPWLAFSRSREA